MPGVVTTPLAVSGRSVEPEDDSVSRPLRSMDASSLTLAPSEPYPRSVPSAAGFSASSSSPSTFFDASVSCVDVETMEP